MARPVPSMWFDTLTCRCMGRVPVDGSQIRKFSRDVVRCGAWQYRCLRNKRPSQPYEFIGFGAMDVTKLHIYMWFGEIHGPNPYEFIWFRWAFISQTPVLTDGYSGWFWTAPDRTGNFGWAGRQFAASWCTFICHCTFADEFCEHLCMGMRGIKVVLGLARPVNRHTSKNTSAKAS